MQCMLVLMKHFKRLQKKIPLSVLGVSSQRFFRALEVAPPWPGVA